MGGRRRVQQRVEGVSVNWVSYGGPSGRWSLSFGRYLESDAFWSTLPPTADKRSLVDEIDDAKAVAAAPFALHGNEQSLALRVHFEIRIDRLRACRERAQQ